MFSKTQYTIAITLSYMLGIIAYFKECVILFSVLFFIATIFLLVTKKITNIFALVLTIIFISGVCYTNHKMKKDDLLKTLAPTDATIKGQVVSIPTTTHLDKTKFFVNVSSIKVNTNEYKTRSKTFVTVERSDNVDIKIGDEIEFWGMLRVPQDATNPSQFSYRNYLKNFNTFTTVYVARDALKITAPPSTTKWIFIQKLNLLRQNIISKHAQIIKSPNLEILGGIVFGDDAINPPPDIKMSFIHSGLMHVLAASGLNVALIFGIWFFIFTRLKFPYKLGITIGILLIFIYTLMTGLGPPVLRASLMLTFGLVGKLIDRDADNIALLLLVATILLIYNPASLFDVGFQLSFSVTLGLLLFCPIFAEKTKNIPQWLAGAIYVPIIAQVVIAPIQMFYFNNIAIYSILANICSIPLVSAISFLGFVSSILAGFPKLPSFIIFAFDYVMNPILSGLVAISNFFSALPNSLLLTIQPSFFQIVIYYSLLVTIYFLFIKTFNKKNIFIFILLCFVLLISLLKPKNTNLEAIFFNVGNADAIFVKTPDKKYVLIDTGRLPFLGNYSSAKSVIYEYLKDNKIKQIDYLILTHFDSDHAGGAITIMDLIKVKNLVISSYEDDAELSVRIPQYAKEKNINIIYPNNEKTLVKYPNGEMKVYQSNKKKLDSNNLSIITSFTLNDKAMLFMGDAEISIAEDINIPSEIRVLKVGHHGAENTVTTDFLQDKKVDVAILSTGPSAYEHPSSSTIKAIQKSDSVLLRTDVDNALKVVIDKRGRRKVYSFNKNKWLRVK